MMEWEKRERKTKDNWFIPEVRLMSAAVLVFLLLLTSEATPTQVRLQTAIHLHTVQNKSPRVHKDSVQCISLQQVAMSL